MNVSIIVVPREKLSATADSLASLATTLQDGDQAIVSLPDAFIDSLDSQFRAELEERGFEFVPHTGFKEPHRARGDCVAMARHEWIIFCDNDIEYAPDWLTALKTFAQSGPYDIIAPLIFIGPPAFETIHHAGGLLVFKESDIGEKHRMMNKSWHDEAVRSEVTSDAYRQCEIGEFHCMAVKRSVLDGGITLPPMLITREQLDFALQVRESDFKVGFCHASHVTYMARSTFTLTDLRYHLDRWSHERASASLDYIDDRWGIAIDRKKILHNWIAQHRKRAALSYCDQGPFRRLLPESFKLRRLQKKHGLII